MVACAALGGGEGLSREEGPADPGVKVGAGMGVIADCGSKLLASSSCCRLSSSLLILSASKGALRSHVTSPHLWQSTM